MISVRSIKPQLSLLLFSIFVFFSSSCAPKRYEVKGKEMLGDVERISYERAVDKYLREKDHKTAAEMIEELCKNFPTSFYCIRGKIFIIQMLSELKRDEEVLKRGNEFLKFHRHDPQASLCIYYILKSLIRLKRIELLEEYLKLVREDELPEDKREEIQFLRAEFACKQGDFDGCFSLCIPLYQKKTGFEGQCSVIINSIMNKVNVELVLNYSSILSSFPQYSLLMLSLADKYGQKGDINSAIMYLKKVKLDNFFWLKRKVDERIREIENWHKEDPLKIGVIFSSQGAGRTGEEFLKGIFFAFQKTPLTKDIKVFLSEVGEGNDEIIDGFFKLMDKGKPVLILSSLSTITNISSLITSFKVPTVTFVPREGLSDASPYLFRFYFSPSSLVKRLVEYLTDEQFTKFAILFPKDGFGKYMMNLFWNEVEARGGEIVMAKGYEPEAIDIRNDIKILGGTYYEDVWKKEFKKEGESEDVKIKPAPFIDFEVIFIPDSPRKSAFIIRQLAYEDITGVVIAGTHLWYDRAFIQIGERMVEGVVFPVGFFPETQKENVKRFVEEFKGEYGDLPSFPSVYSYELAHAVFEFIDESLPGTAGLKKFLSNLHRENGIIGLYQMNEKREIVDDAEIITVKNGRFVER